MSTETESKTDEKVLTNSRWQDGNKVPRFDKNQQKDLDTVLEATPGFFRGYKLNK